MEHNSTQCNCSLITKIQEGRSIRSQKSKEYLEALHLAATQFCDLPGFYRKTGFLRSYLLGKMHFYKYEIIEYTH